MKSTYFCQGDNLHYKVIPKVQSISAVLKEITEYICQQHLNESGIVYCFTKKVSSAIFLPSLFCFIIVIFNPLQEAADVAAGLREYSGGAIKSAAFHSKLSSTDKASPLPNFVML